MAYDPTKDFVALWRLNAGQVLKAEMPGLDYVVAAFARAGLITLSVGAVAPVVNQPTTAWLQTAVPSNSAEGVLRLWNPATGTYVAATQALYVKMMETAAGQNGVSWWTSIGGPPANIIGNDGDFAVRTDAPNGIYGPKVAGAWPAQPIPGTADVITSVSLDNTFGTAEGDIIVRGPALWGALPIGPAGSIMVSTGLLPVWEALSTLLDAVFGNVQGSILYRDAGLWNDLPPGAAGQILGTNGPAANPLWVPRTAEFPSGTVMLFQQTTAPPGWTKQVAVNDYGLRVVSGTAGVTPGSAFSTVFAQSVVGGHTQTIAEMPSHDHPYTAPGGPQSLQGGGTFPGSNIGSSSGTTSPAGLNGSHNHSVNLTLAYVDVIIASKN